MGRLTDDNGNATGLRWTLADHGMDILERAGLAALYMTLRAAEEQAGDDKADAVRDVLKWDLTPNSVELRWGEPKAAKPALEALFAFAWQVRDGVLYLPAVHRDDRQRDTYFLRLAEHNGILRTSLQSKSQKKEPMTTQVEAIDEDKQFVFRFQPLNSKLAPHSTVSKLLMRGRFRENDTSAKAWVKPGIEPRFANVEKDWQGAPELTLLLMLAPIVCLYQQIQGERSSELQVIPDIRNLEEFGEVRPEVRLDPVSAAGPGDAAATFLAEYTTRSIQFDLQIGCRVVVIGIADYYHKSNKTRKSVLNIRADQGTLAVRRCRILHRVMPSEFRERRRDATTTGGTRDPSRPLGFFPVPSARGRIADNLINHRPWYTDIAVPPRWEQDALKNQQDQIKRQDNTHISIDRLWFDNLHRYQWRLLMQLASEHRFWQSDQERLFHEAFRKILWRLIEREKQAARRRGGSRTEEDRIEDLYDDLYRRLTRAKTRHLLRQELAAMMAEPPGRFSRPSTLREHPDAIWALMRDGHDWKKARDLALLTLASYGQFRGRTETPDTSSTEGGQA